MKHMTTYWIVIGLLVSIDSSFGQPTTAPATRSSSEGLAERRAGIEFRRPPSSGVPQGDGTAASRGGKGVPTPVLFAESGQPGITISSNPTICFYIAEPTKSRAVVTLSDPINQTTLAVKSYRDGFPSAGVYRVRVDDLKEPLTPGGIYTWNVSIYSTTRNNADNAVALALMRYEPDEQLSQKVSNLPAEERARLLAESGIWFDMIAALSEAIEARPGDPFLRAQRTKLLTEQKKENAPSFEQSGESR